MSRESHYSYETLDYVSGAGATSVPATVGVLISVSRTIDRYQERLRELTSQPLPGMPESRLAIAAPAARLLALQAAPSLLLEVRTHASPALLATLDAMQGASDAVAVQAFLGRPETHRAAEGLAPLVSQAIDRQVVREHAWLKGTIEASILEAGYELVPLPGQLPSQPLILRGRHADGTLMSFEADARVGRLSLDLDGFSNGACVGARDRIATSLARRDLKTRLISESKHCELAGALTTRLDKVLGRKRREAAGTKPAAPKQRAPRPRVKG